MRFISQLVAKTRDMSTKAKTAVIVGTMAVLSSTAHAQELVPAELGDIVFPIDLESIAIAVATAGAAMIGLLAIYQIGFKLVRKFINRAGNVV